MSSDPRDTPLPAVGTTLRFDDENYIVAAGIHPASWANTSAKLVLIQFTTRTVLHLLVRMDSERKWRAVRALIKFQR